MSHVMSKNETSVLSSTGVMLLWPNVLTRSVSSSTQTADTFPSAALLLLFSGQEGELPLVVKRSTQNCDGTFDSYCMNSGQCMLLVDINEHHCKCERGFYGPRCSNLELVVQPMGEEQLIVTIFCVALLIIGLAGTLYFCCKWYGWSL
uniref:EGF-like domain-containing protein n=1 Tax=Cyclopterus lumpus TaxID=8103 RepID=A0A8C3A2I0_CYCLU